MKLKTLLFTALFATVSTVHAEEVQTSKDMAATFESLGDALIALRKTEENFIHALLDQHRHAAEAMLKGGNVEGAAAQMSMWANEGDNAIGGVRKKLLEGGHHHHHHTSAEQQGAYEPGYIVVTREAKKAALDAVAALQKAKDDGEKKAAWEAFQKAVDSVKKK